MCVRYNKAIQAGTNVASTTAAVDYDYDWRHFASVFNPIKIVYFLMRDKTFSVKKNISIFVSILDGKIVFNWAYIHDSIGEVSLHQPAL